MSKKVTARVIPPEERGNILPTKFPNSFLHVEMGIFDWMARLCPGYNGGLWELVELSNGGFFMFLPSEEKVHLVNPMNGSEEHLTPEAAGVAVCLIAMSHLSFQRRDDDIANNYYFLRDYMFDGFDKEETAKLLSITD